MASSTSAEPTTASADADPVKLLRMVLSGLLADGRFTVPTEEAKVCLDLAQRIVKLFVHVGPQDGVCRLSNWLIPTLQTVIDQSFKRKKGVVNQDKLWSKYHIVTSSSSFITTWENFMVELDLSAEPMFYQHVTDELFDMLIKNTVKPLVTCSELQCQNLTYEEENAVRYVGGYILRTLAQKSNDSIKSILQALMCADGEGPAQDWVNEVDRGGLTRITGPAFQLFYSIELCMRRYFTSKNTADMDSTFRDHVTKCTVEDDDVLFQWCMAGQSEDDENANQCLQKIVHKWITVRGHSFAANMLEMYKQANKKGTGKSKSLRSNIFSEKQ